MILDARGIDETSFPAAWFQQEENHSCYYGESFFLHKQFCQPYFLV
jgi:hypothetical protein